MSRVTIDPLKALDENGDYPPIWSPEPGDSIKGVIRRYTETTLEKSGHSWICTIQTGPDTVESVFLTPTVLKSEFARKKPKTGERIGIKYLGTPTGKAYKKYVVTLPDREDSSLVPDWDELDSDQGNYNESVPDAKTGPYAAATLTGSGKANTAVAVKPVGQPAIELEDDEDPFRDA